MHGSQRATCPPATLRSSPPLVPLELALSKNYLRYSSRQISRELATASRDSFFLRLYIAGGRQNGGVFSRRHTMSRDRKFRLRNVREREGKRVLTGSQHVSSSREAFFFPRSVRGRPLSRVSTPRTAREHGGRNRAACRPGPVPRGVVTVSIVISTAKRVFHT